MREYARIEADMVQRIREILLTEYIGAILVAFLCGNAVIDLVSLIVRDVGWFVWQQNVRTDFLRPTPVFAWDRVILSIVTIVLKLVVAYLLARWLYPSAFATPEPVVGDDSDLAEEGENA